MQSNLNPPRIRTRIRTRIRPESAENPQRIRPESAENPQRIRRESVKNPPIDYLPPFFGSLPPPLHPPPNHPLAAIKDRLINIDQQ